MSDATETRPSGRGRPAWAPEAEVEVAGLLRVLMTKPWLFAGRDDDAISKVKLHVDDLRDVFGRLGWVLVVERDLVRLRKTPPRVRDAAGPADPPARVAQWFFLLVAAAESMGRRVGLGALVNAARAAAAEAEVPTTGDRPERLAIVAALKMLTARGAIEELDGSVDGYATDDDPPVLIAVHHTRLLHVVANYSPEHDPLTDPDGWLAAVSREPEPARRMRRRLIDDPVVHSCDLDDDEAEWLSRRLREDGGPLADAFGLHIERRSEGAAFVVPESAFRYNAELGPLPFPSSGTVAHAALLVCRWATDTGTATGDMPAGWRSVASTDVTAKLAELADEAGHRGWAGELREDPAGRFRTEIREFLVGLDLLRCVDDCWWFSPAVARWPIPSVKAPRPKPKTRDADQPSFDFGAPDDAHLA